MPNYKNTKGAIFYKCVAVLRSHSLQARAGVCVCARARARVCVYIYI